jgi:hypothetical protein
MTGAMKAQTYFHTALKCSIATIFMAGIAFMIQTTLVMNGPVYPPGSPNFANKLPLFGYICAGFGAFVAVCFWHMSAFIEDIPVSRLVVGGFYAALFIYGFVTLFSKLSR